MERDMEKYSRVSEILAIFQAYGFVDRKKLKKAQDIGTVIHAAIEEYFNDGFTPLDRIRSPHFESFLKWAESCSPKPLKLETRLFDDELMITGQFDMLAEIDGVKYLVDFKTGSWSHPEIWNLQMHFYRKLLETNKINGFDHFLIVHLKKDGTEPDLHHFKADPYVSMICAFAYECHRYFKESVDIK